MIHPICLLQHQASTWELRLCVDVCVCAHMSECNFDVSSLSFSISIFMHVHMYVCVCVCLKIHQACPGFLQRPFAVSSNQPPLPMSEHTNPFVYLSTCCVCGCVSMRVCVSMLIQGRALPNTPWKHSIHQQLEEGALGPALHFHWERGRQRRGEKEDTKGTKGGAELWMFLSLPWGTGGMGRIYLYINIRVKKDTCPPRIVLLPSVEVNVSVNKTQKEAEKLSKK